MGSKRWLPVVAALLAAGVVAQAQPATNAAANAPGTNAAPARAQFSIQINDGMGQPVSGVAVEVYRIAKPTNGEEQKIVLGTAVSEGDGIAQGLYDKASIPEHESFLVTLTKSGYAGYTAGPMVNYVLKRQFHSNDVARIAKLSNPEQKIELPQLLAGEMDSPKISLPDLVFAHESALYSVLKWLVDDKYVGLQAEEMLAYIAKPDDVRLILGASFLPKGNPAANRWANEVASALLAPSSDNEWDFLWSCATNAFDDHWVDTAGIRSLRLIASPHSLQLLKEAREVNGVRTNEIDAAIAYIGTHPGPLEGRTAAAAAQKAAQALGEGSWLGNEPPRYNDKGDKALVDCNFIVGGVRYIVYTATFHKVGDLWKLRGVRETIDTVLPQGPQPRGAQSTNGQSRKQ
jgi:hypothetical protein